MYCRIVVAAVTELAFGVHGNRLACSVLARMTVYAARKTVFAAPNTLMHGEVSLVFDELEVIATHHLRGLHAMLELVRFRGTFHRFAGKGGAQSAQMWQPTQRE